MAHDDPRDRADQRTVLLPRRDRGAELKPGHRLQEFVVERLLGVGGYSIVYLARDTRLDRRIALKEYLPATLAMRVPGSAEVAPRLPRFQEFFDRGLASFINEARLLGAFDHPSLLKVYRFWAENGTAYMVMPYYEGVTLKKWLADLGTAPSERWLRELAEPLMTALAVMHEQRCYHRDVAPDNILMLYDRSGGNYLEQTPRPVLLDFGAARRVIGDATQNLTAILKSGYSPVEQYEGDQGLRQGPWTDIYALCAVLYTAALGRAPASSIARLVRDEHVPARVAGRGRYSERFLAAIDAGLHVRPEQRPQHMAALRALFDAPAAAAVDVALDFEPPPSTVPASAAAPARLSPRPRWLRPGLGAALLALLLAAAAWLQRG